MNVPHLLSALPCVSNVVFTKSTHVWYSCHMSHTYSESNFIFRKGSQNQMKWRLRFFSYLTSADLTWVSFRAFNIIFSILVFSLSLLRKMQCVCLVLKFLCFSFVFFFYLDVGQTVMCWCWCGVRCQITAALSRHICSMTSTSSTRTRNNTRW